MANQTSANGNTSSYKDVVSLHLNGEYIGKVVLSGKRVNVEEITGELFVKLVNQGVITCETYKAPASAAVPSLAALVK